MKIRHSQLQINDHFKIEALVLKNNKFATC
jgi:hypothetical protein